MLVYFFIGICLKVWQKTSKRVLNYQANPVGSVQNFAYQKLSTKKAVYIFLLL